MSTRYTNAKVNDTWEPPFKFKKEDGTEGISVPPHVSGKVKCQRFSRVNLKQFSGIEKDEVIPKEWLEKMDYFQHKLTADVKWDVGDVLVIDVSKKRGEISNDPCANGWCTYRILLHSMRDGLGKASERFWLASGTNPVWSGNQWPMLRFEIHLMGLLPPVVPSETAEFGATTDISCRSSVNRT